MLRFRFKYCVLLFSDLPESMCGEVHTLCREQY